MTGAPSRVVRWQRLHDAVRLLGRSALTKYQLAQSLQVTDRCALRLIQRLQARPVGKRGQATLWRLHRCPLCGDHFEEP